MKRRRLPPEHPGPCRIKIWPPSSKLLQLRINFGAGRNREPPSINRYGKEEKVNGPKSQEGFEGQKDRPQGGEAGQKGDPESGQKSSPQSEQQSKSGQEESCPEGCAEAREKSRTQTARTRARSKPHTDGTTLPAGSARTIRHRGRRTADVGTARSDGHPSLLSFHRL